MLRNSNMGKGYQSNDKKYSMIILNWIIASRHAIDAYFITFAYCMLKRKKWETLLQVIVLIFHLIVKYHVFSQMTNLTIL